jgi:hypothetical protein
MLFTKAPSDTPRLPFTILNSDNIRASILPEIPDNHPISANFNTTHSTTSYHFHESTSEAPILVAEAKHEVREANAATKKKYKPVALKVRPVIGELPEKF